MNTSVTKSTTALC